MRRTPAAAPVSCVNRNSAIWPVAGTCVPPHSSSESPGTSTTRTTSPYYAVDNAIAPAPIAPLYSIPRVDVEGVLREHDFDPVFRLAKLEDLGLGRGRLVSDPLLLLLGLHGAPLAGALHYDAWGVSLFQRPRPGA